MCWSFLNARGNLMVAYSKHPPTPYIHIVAAFAMDVNNSMLIIRIMGHVDEYPTMNYFGNPRHSVNDSM